MWQRQTGKPVLIVGLGNPGRSYAQHRHNAGFMVLDRLSGEGRRAWSKDKEKAQIAQAEIEGVAVVLVKPQTYMNLSGKAVAPILGRFKADPAGMIVVHDDLDLPLGKVRIKVGGGDGGHKGVRSISDSLRFRDFIRIRLGVGRPPTGVNPEEFVLTSFPFEEKDAREDLIETACRAVGMILIHGVERAQNLIHPAKSVAKTGT